MTELTIGRDVQTSLLRITANGKTATLKEAPVCPSSVSREHALITVSDKGVVVIRNLNIENDLYVNGIGVEQKRIAAPDRIELGRDRYQLSWDVITPLIPHFVNISPLRQVWQDYESRLLALEISERRFGVLRSATGLITMAAILLSIFAGRSTLYIVLYALAAIVSVVFFVMAFRSASKIPQRRRQLREETERNYCCPACGAMFSLQKYEQLRQTKRCAHCGAYFKEE